MTESLRILLVEDNPGDARLLECLLQEDEACRCGLIHVESLEAALSEVSRHQFDLAMLDLSLPDSIGMETLTKLQAGAPNLPIIVLSGRIDDLAEEEALSLGAKKYLVKGDQDGPEMGQLIRAAVAGD